MKTTETMPEVILQKERLHNNPETATVNSYFEPRSFDPAVSADDAFVTAVEQIAFSAPVEEEIVERGFNEQTGIVSKCRLDLSYLRSFANGDKEFENEMLASALEDM